MHLKLPPAKSLYVVAIIFLAGCCSNTSSDKMVDRAFNVSQQHAENMCSNLAEFPQRLPKTAKNDSLITCNAKWWTSGFFPGTLWYLYQYTKDDKVRDMAQEMTARMISEEFNTRDHDVGFQINCSAGNGYRLTKNRRYKEAIINGANSLITRFDSVVGCTKSWTRPNWTYPVIIDNLMNLELLTIATRLTGDSIYLKVAKSHADKTMANHFRDDYSSYHLVDYAMTGEPLKKMTHQGYKDNSAWSRGQAWALYGYTMMFRETGEPRYLNHAINVGNFIADHPRLPEDKVPFWDFDTPAIPDTPRDASAAAVMASAFLELSTYTSDDTSKKFYSLAQQQIRSLCSKEYMAEPTKNADFILMHSTGSFPKQSEVDVPLNYADYYFVEALTRYNNIICGAPVVEMIMD